MQLIKQFYEKGAQIPLFLKLHQLKTHCHKNETLFFLVLFLLLKMDYYYFLNCFDFLADFGFDSEVYYFLGLYYCSY